MRTANPALNANTFAGPLAAAGRSMTLNGTVQKTGILLLLVFGCAAYTWRIAATEGNAMPWILGGALGGFVVALVTCFKKSWAPVTAPLYAVLEGLFLGAVSAYANLRFPGIVFSAVGATFGTLFALLFAYQSGFIRATENFKLGVFTATGGICFIYVLG